MISINNLATQRVSSIGVELVNEYLRKFVDEFLGVSLFDCSFDVVCGHVIPTELDVLSD